MSEFRKLYDEIGDDAIEIIDSLGITSENLNDVIPDYKRRQFKRKIEAWKEDGIVKGYFAYMITSLTRYTYAKVFEVLIYGLYLTKNKQINALSNQVFKEAVQDCYDQGKKDLKQPTRKLKWAFILPLLMMPDLNISYEEYLEALGHTAAQETYRRIIEHIKLKLKVTFDILKDLLRKQINRILNINRDKYSGVIVEVVRGAGNKGYIGADDEKDELIKFIAEMDDRTTRMCTSLDGQIFHTRAWNRFTRYSDYYKGLHTFNCFGLEQGLNLPPINDHFHWCRSTVTYQLDVKDKKDLKNGFIDITNEWLSDKKKKGTIEENRDSVIGNDGKLYKRGDSGVDMTFEPKAEDRVSAQWWVETKGGDVKLNPRLNKPENVKTSDLTIDGEQVEVKTPTGSSRNTIKNQFSKTKQATTYLINIGNSGLTEQMAIEQCADVFSDGMLSYVNMIILRNNNKLLKVFKRI